MKKVGFLVLSVLVNSFAQGGVDSDVKSAMTRLAHEEKNRFIDETIDASSEIFIATHIGANGILGTNLVLVEEKKIKNKTLYRSEKILNFSRFDSYTLDDIKNYLKVYNKKRYIKKGCEVLTVISWHWEDKDTS